MTEQQATPYLKSVDAVQNHIPVKIGLHLLSVQLII
jgi:hypothetical protein